MTETATVRVGDKLVFLTSRNAEPQIATVTKVTKSGMIETDLTGKGSKYKVRSSGWWESVGGFSSRTLRPLETLEKHKQEWEDRQRESRERAEKRQAAADQSLAETKAAIGDTWAPLLKMTHDLGGTRLYVLDVPLQSGSRSVLMVTCWQPEPRVGETEPPDGVQTTYTYVRSGGGSFPSCSDYRCESDDEAVWAAIDAAYHSRW